MKKFLLILLVPMMLLAGCDGSDEQADLKHKETCAKYSEKMQKTMGLTNDGFTATEKSLSGVYWSEEKNSCVAIVFTSYKNAYDWGTSYEYYDAITNTLLWTIPQDGAVIDNKASFKEFAEKNKVRYEESLKLLR